MNLRNIFVSLYVCLAVLIGGSAEAATATLIWNRSPEPNVVGYRLSIGNVPGVYTQTIDVGNTVRWTLQNLSDTQTYYFAVQAYDAAGRLSAYSTEVTRGSHATALLDASADAAAASVRSDLVWQHEDGRVSVWGMNGATRFDQVALSRNLAPDRDWRIVGAGDFNQDHKRDFVWHHRTSGQVAISLMDGRTFLRSVTVGTEARTNWSIVAVGDMDADTNPDLVWQDSTSGNLAVWLMTGTKFSKSVQTSPGSVAVDTWKIVGAADFDLDGSTDLLWQHKNGSLSVWFMNGVSRRDTRYLTPASVDETWTVVAVADYNQDGYADLVFQKDDGHLAMWFLNGTAMTSSVLLNPSQEQDPQWRIVGSR